MGNKKHKKVSKPKELKEESSGMREKTPAPEPHEEERNVSEWLLLTTMQGTEIRCAKCRALLDLNKGTIAALMFKNKYCFNCGAEMKMKEI